MSKGKRNTIDPKEKLRLLKEDLEKKTALAAKAQEKLKEEENRQLEKCFTELRSLCKKADSDIYELCELVRLFAEQDISISSEIKRLSGVQLDFDSITDETAEQPKDADTTREIDSHGGNYSHDGNVVTAETATDDKNDKDAKAVS